MVRVFLVSASVLLSAASVAATPASSPDQLEEQQMLQAVMDAALAQMLERGPKQEGWSQGGVDVYEIMRTSPGGAKQNYLLSVDKDGERQITIIDADMPDTYLPKSWKLVLREGETGAKGGPILTMGSLDGPFFMAGWDKVRPVGDAYCSDGGSGAELYETSDPTAEPEIPRALVPTMFASTVRHLRDKVLCWRYDRDGDGFKATYFMEDGSTLPVINAYEERVMIIPAGPIAKLLEQTPAK